MFATQEIVYSCPIAQSPAIDIDHLDAWEHIVKTTFDPSDIFKAQPSKRKHQSQQEIATKKRVDNMTMHNCKVVKNHHANVRLLESKGVFCCDSLSSSGTPCMCTFSTRSGLERHKNKGDHKYPTPDLASWVHDLHTSGKFAFSLATGEYSLNYMISSTILLMHCPCFSYLKYFILQDPGQIDQRNPILILG